MADKVTKRIEIELLARDQASQVFQQAGAAAQRFKTDMWGVRSPVEALRPTNRSQGDQDVRDAMAERIRTMRAESRRAMAETEAEARLFGRDTGKAVAESVGAAVDGGKGGSGGFLGSLKDSFGRGSEFGQFARLLRGSGPVIGLAVAAQTIEKMAAAALNLRNEIAAGDKSVGEMVQDLGRGLPIIGSLVNAGQSIYDLFSGEAAAVSRINAETETANHLMEARNILAQQSRQRAREEAEARRQAIGFDAEQNHRRAAAVSEGRALESVDLQAKREAEMRAITDAAAKRKEQLDIDSKAATESINKQREQAGELKNPNRFAQMALAMSGNADIAKNIQDEATKLNEGIKNARANFDRRIADEAKRSASEQSKIEVERIRESIELQKTWAAESAKIARDRARLDQEALESEWQQTAAAQANVRAEQLDRLGQTAAATRVRVKQEMDAQFHAIDEHVKAKEREGVSNIDAIKEDAKWRKWAIADAARDKVAAADEQQYLADRRRQMDITGQVEQAHIEAIRQQGEAGNYAAQVEARRLEIAMQARREQERIAELLRDPKLNAAQRGQLQGLQFQDFRNQMRAMFGAKRLETSPLATAEEGGYTTGVIQNAQRAAKNEQVEQVKESNKRLDKLIDLWVKYFQQRGQSPDISLVPVS